jgi:hypothetical protein
LRAHCSAGFLEGGSNRGRVLGSYETKADVLELTGVSCDRLIGAHQNDDVMGPRRSELDRVPATQVIVVTPLEVAEQPCPEQSPVEVKGPLYIGHPESYVC